VRVIRDSERGDQSENNSRKTRVENEVIGAREEKEREPKVIQGAARFGLAVLSHCVRDSRGLSCCEERKRPPEGDR